MHLMIYLRFTVKNGEFRELKNEKGEVTNHVDVGYATSAVRTDLVLGL